MEDRRQGGKVSRDADVETSPGLSYYWWEMMASGGDSINIYILTASPTLHFQLRRFKIGREILYFYLFIYLTVLGLSCGHGIFFFFLAVACELLVEPCGI